MFEAAIMTYKQKVRTFEIPPVQVFIYKIKTSFVQYSRPLPRLAQFLPVSAKQFPLIKFRHLFCIIKDERTILVQENTYFYYKNKICRQTNLSICMVRIVPKHEIIKAASEKSTLTREV